MLTYYKLLQIHAKTPSIILPTETCIFWSDKITENNDNYVLFQVYFIISGLYSYQSNGGTKANNCGTAFQGRIRRNFDEKNNVHTKQTKMEQWVHHKYNVAFEAVIMNAFLSDGLKEEIFGIIEKTQRSYFALKRFLHICRFKNTKIKIDTDLCLNPIDPQKAFTIVQNGCKYLFTVPDILNLTMAALMNAHEFFAEPRFPKNPYTNVKFTKTDLYNIYFRVVESRFITPPLFTECFLCHFELDNFLIDNETKLRNLSIKSYVMNSPHTILYSEVMFMIRTFFKGKQVTNRRTRIPRTRGNGTRIITSTTRISINIHPEFPREVLVDVMRPYLYLYLLYHDHIRGTEKMTIARTLLQREVQRFLKYNPNFGRKQINTSYQNNLLTTNSSLLLRNGPNLTPEELAELGTRLGPQNRVREPIWEFQPLSTQGGYLQRGSLAEGRDLQRGSLTEGTVRVLTSSFNDRHEIFTVQTADEMFNTKILLQKNNEISVIESESSDDDDDDSATEVYGIYDYGFGTSAASHSATMMLPPAVSASSGRNSPLRYEFSPNLVPSSANSSGVRLGPIVDSIPPFRNSEEEFMEDFRNNYSETNYIGLAILFTGTYGL